MGRKGRSKQRDTVTTQRKACKQSALESPISAHQVCALPTEPPRQLTLHVDTHVYTHMFTFISSRCPVLTQGQ